MDRPLQKRSIGTSGARRCPRARVDGSMQAWGTCKRAEIRSPLLLQASGLHYSVCHARYWPAVPPYAAACALVRHVVSERGVPDGQSIVSVPAAVVRPALGQDIVWLACMCMRSRAVQHPALLNLVDLAPRGASWNSVARPFAGNLVFAHLETMYRLHAIQQECWLPLRTLAGPGSRSSLCCPSWGTSQGPCPLQASDLTANADVAQDVPVCWICLGEQPGLLRPCACPRFAHATCLARWQLQSAGSR